jgi:hypothetical protein
MKRFVILVVVLIVAAVALITSTASAAPVREPLDSPVPHFSAKDRANALALLRSTANWFEPHAYLRCGIRHRLISPTGTRMMLETLECVRYGKPAFANRYHRDVFSWQRYEGGLIMTMRRDGKETVMVARVAGISPKSFRMVQLICGKGDPSVRPCP